MSAQRNKTATAAGRAVILIHKQHIARDANLNDSLGIANAIAETLESLRHLFPQSVGDFNDALLDYYGPAAPLNPNTPHVYATLDTLWSCLAVVPPFIFPAQGRIEG